LLQSVEEETARLEAAHRRLEAVDRAELVGRLAVVDTKVEG
jgi:hypothetical protein